MPRSRVLLALTLAIVLLVNGLATRSTATARAVVGSVRPPAPTLLETLFVDMSDDTVTQSQATLSAGAHYEIDVSGTWTWTEPSSPPAGWNFDALFCYNDFGWSSPQCRPEYRHALLYIGTGDSPTCPQVNGFASCAIDAYQQAGGGGTELAYSTGHAYHADFYPLANGHFVAGSFQAFDKCTQHSTCTAGLSGTITIKIYSDAATVTLPNDVRATDTPARMKDRIPPRVSTTMAVKVSGASSDSPVVLESTGGPQLTFNGKTTDKIKTDGTFHVNLSATDQTACGAGPDVRVQAYQGSQLLAETKPFAVSAIPYGFTEPLKYTLIGANTRGIVVDVTWKSDSGNIADLDCVDFTEVVQLKNGDGTSQTSDYLPMNGYITDTHSTPIQAYIPTRFASSSRRTPSSTSDRNRRISP